MCIRKKNGKWVFDATATWITVAGVIITVGGAAAVIRAACAYAHEKLFIPAIENRTEKVFNDLHKPFADTMHCMMINQAIMVEMLKEQYGQAAYLKAKDRVENVGKFGGGK
jgi:hypothetical protein